MGTTIRPEISRESKYWINKNRYYELKHFCLQYPIWKRSLRNMQNSVSSSVLEREPSGNLPCDPTGNRAISNLYYSNKIKMVERTAEETDSYLSSYLLKAVTEGLSYAVLKSRFDLPCSRDMYYDRYRRFFWLLSQERD